MTTNRYLKTHDVAWEATETPGFWVKCLHEDKDKGESTWLMKSDAGFASPPHAHTDFEEVFILEGEFFDGEQTLGPGDYVAREPGAMHEGSSDAEVIMLVSYRKR